MQYLILGAKARAAPARQLHGPPGRRPQAVAAPVLTHRMITTFAAQSEGIDARQIVHRLVAESMEERQASGGVSPHDTTAKGVSEFEPSALGAKSRFDGVRRPTWSAVSATGTDTQEACGAATCRPSVLLSSGETSQVRIELTSVGQRRRAFSALAPAMLWALLLLAAAASPAQDRPAAESPAAKADRVVTEAFAKLDTDSSGQLTREEYASRGGGPAAMLDRDFKLFDFDASGNPLKEEFSAIPGLIPAAEQRAVPDPFDMLLDQAVAAMDEIWGDWDKDPNGGSPSFLRPGVS